MVSMEKSVFDFTSTRLRKELMNLASDPSPNIHVDFHQIEKNIKEWQVKIESPTDSIYHGEDYVLNFKFPEKYPFESPTVTFAREKVPVHPHIYSNGHICLSILSEDWSAALSVRSVALSIISMLASCKEKKRPPDDLIYVKTCNKNPKNSSFIYHDDQI